MSNFLLIFVSLGFGILLGRLKILPQDAHKSINAWLFYLVIPAVALRFVPEIEWSSRIALPLFAPVVVWCGAWAFVRLCDWKMRLDPASRTALLITCGLGNTSFLGFPMIAAFYGEERVRDGIVFDQLTFLVFSTLGVIAILKAAGENGGGAGFTSVLGRVLRFPPFIGCALALVLSPFFDISVINPFLDKIVATMSPMALFSIGLQLRFGGIRQEWRLLTAGLFYKLMLAPVLVLALGLALHTGGAFPKISVFQAGMPAHITASLLASQYKLNPRFCSLIVGFGILLTFATAAFWYLILDNL